MRCIAIIGAGVIALLVMEVAYSVAIGRYELHRAGKESTPPFFNGPIAATLRSFSNR